MRYEPHCGARQPVGGGKHAVDGFQIRPDATDDQTRGESIDAVYRHLISMQGSMPRRPQLDPAFRHEKVITWGNRGAAAFVMESTR